MSTTVDIEYINPPDEFTVLPYIPQPRLKGADVTPEQRKDTNNRRQEASLALTADLEEWYAETLAKAEAISQAHGKSVQQILSLFFSTSPRAVKQDDRKVNLWNAFMWKKAQGNTSLGGGSGQLLELVEESKQEYCALQDDEEEQEKLTEEYIEGRKIKRTGMRLGRKSQAAIFASASKDIKSIFAKVSKQIPVEGFACLIRKSTDLQSPPRWIFTDPRVENYLPIAVGRHWDTYVVGTRIEAFLLAGASKTGENLTNKSRGLFLKAGIRSSINRKLVAITTNPEAMMSYENVYRDVVKRYGVELVGWTHEKFANPSQLGSQIAPLEELFLALERDECKFVRLSAEELKAKDDMFKQGVVDGDILLKPRKKRKDAGTKRKAYPSAEIVPLDSDEDEDHAGERAPPNPPKKKKKRSHGKEKERAQDVPEPTSVPPTDLVPVSQPTATTTTTAPALRPLVQGDTTVPSAHPTQIPSTLMSQPTPAAPAASSFPASYGFAGDGGAPMQQMPSFPYPYPYAPPSFFVPDPAQFGYAPHPPSGQFNPLFTAPATPQFQQQQPPGILSFSNSINVPSTSSQASLPSSSGQQNVAPIIEPSSSSAFPASVDPEDASSAKVSNKRAKKTPTAPTRRSSRGKSNSK